MTREKFRHGRPRKTFPARLWPLASVISDSLGVEAKDTEEDQTYRGVINHIPCGLSICFSGSGCNRSAAIAGKCALAEPGGGISKNIVDGPFHVAIRIVLPAGLCIKSVLKSVEAACVIALLVAVGNESHSLSASSEGVFEVDAVGPEVGTDNVQSAGCVQVARRRRTQTVLEGDYVGLVGAGTA